MENDDKVEFFEETRKHVLTFWLICIAFWFRSNPKESEIFGLDENNSDFFDAQFDYFQIHFHFFQSYFYQN
ncbi:hypothetical protein LIHA111178_13940 [Litorimonas haliclonae]